MQATMQALFDRGRYVGEEDPGYYVIESITVGLDGTTAEVVSCWRSTAILYGPPVDPTRHVGPDNPATLANNTPGQRPDYLTGCVSSTPGGGWKGRTGWMKVATQTYVRPSRSCCQYSSPWAPSAR